MKMSTRKKGLDVPSIIVLFVIAVIILLFTLALIRRTFPSFVSSATCEGRAGTCIDKSTGCPLGSHEEFGLSGCTEGQICCVSESRGGTSTSTTSTTQLTTKEKNILKNGIIVTLGNSPTPLTQGAVIPLKVSQTYEFDVVINDQLKNSQQKIGEKCLIYVTDSKNPGKSYVLDGANGLQEATSKYTGQLFDCLPGQAISLTYNPGALDAYKSLTLYTILLDKESSDAIDTQPIAALQGMFSNTKHWLAWKAFPLRIDPVLKITGMSADWTAKDDITITCNGISCTKIEVGILRMGDSETYEDLFGRCSGTRGSSPTFHDTLQYISGTTVQTSGIPLNIDIGGFRLPYQQRIQYVTSTSPIAVVNNKATISIDKAAMIRTFGGSTNTLTEQSPLIGDKTYLCVKATAEGTSPGNTYYALSETPLKVDAIAPVVDAETGITVIYPDPITAVNMTVPYYYRQYPRIQVGGCYDMGQSGCTNYDYYIKTGNFINLNSNTGDWTTGLVGVLLTEGVNSLITYFASKDAANTICPLMTSNGYTRNTNPEIRFMGAGQAIVCIRIGDKVGNTRLVWKPIWSPTEMFNRILVSSI